MRAVESKLSGAYVRFLMRKHGHTIQSLAARMQITHKRVREVRTNGVEGSAYVRDWVEALTCNRS